MDGQQFDRLAKSVSSLGTRRGLVQLVAGLSLGGALVTLLEPESEAKRRRQRRQARHDPGHAKKNRKGKHKGKHKAKTCGDTQSDPNNCGSCGTVCPDVANGDPVCIAGACDVACTNAADPCGGACCGDDQFCDADACVACLQGSDPCTSDAQCCNGDCHTYNGFCNPDV